MSIQLCAYENALRASASGVAGRFPAYFLNPPNQEIKSHPNSQFDKPSNAMYSIVMLSKELIAASTVPLVLSILGEGDSYGYALILRVKELSGGRIAWSEGMLYPVLHWMEDEELIESQWRESDTGRRRKYYRLRKAGRKALQTEQEEWNTVHETLTKLWNTKPNLI